MIEFASLQNILLYAIVAIGAVVVLPIFLYLCVKMATAGFYFGRDAYLKSQKNEESPNGDAERQEEKEG